MCNSSKSAFIILISETTAAAQVYFKPEFAHKNPRTAGPAIAMRTTDSRPPQSMFDAITANRLNRAREAASPESIAPKVSVFLASSNVSHIRGVGSSVLIKGSGCVCLKFHQSTRVLPFLVFSSYLCLLQSFLSTQAH